MIILHFPKANPTAMAAYSLVLKLFVQEQLAQLEAVNMIMCVLFNFDVERRETETEQRQKQTENERQRIRDRDIVRDSERPGE